MKTKTLMTILVGLLALALVSVGLLAANADNPGRGRKPDKLKPVHATDIELVKKITIKGKPPWAGGGGGKKKEVAATGDLGATVPGSGTRYAVVVGISDYPGGENDLSCCYADAIDTASVLTGVYGFSVDTLTNSAATRKSILDAIEGIPIGADEIVFFFSGHGVKGLAQDWDKERVDEGICVWDNNEESGEPIEKMTYIWDGELAEAFSEFETTRIIFIFDTCLAGGMASDLGEPGRVLAMACGENGYSYEDPELENGEFTYYFLQEDTGWGTANVHDYYGSGTGIPEQVTVEEAYDYAKANCKLDRPCISDEFSDDLLP